MRDKNLYIGIFSAIIAMVCAAALLFSDEFTSFWLLLGFLILFIFVLKTAQNIYKIDGHRTLWNPLLVISLYILLSNGIPALVLSVYSLAGFNPLGEQTNLITEALYLSIFSLFVFLLGWRFASILIKKEVSTIIYRTFMPGSLYLILLAVIYFLVLYVRYNYLFTHDFYLGGKFPEGTFYLHELIYSFDLFGCFFMVAVAFYAGHQRKLWGVLFILILTIDISYAVMIAQKERIGAMFLVILFCEAFFSKNTSMKRQAALGISLLLLIGFLGPLFIDIRQEGGVKDTSHFTRILIDSRDAKADNYLIYFIKRIGELEVVAASLETFPERVDFQYGLTYLQGIISIVPGIKEVPITSPNVWGRLLGLARPDDYITGIRVPAIAEGYANFGLFGVFIVAFLGGCFLRYLKKIQSGGMSAEKGLLIFSLYYFFIFLMTGYGFFFIIVKFTHGLPVLLLAYYIIHSSSGAYKNNPVQTAKLIGS